MRISSAQIHQQGTSAMLRQQAKLAKTELQLASNRRMLSPADDPNGSARLLALNQMRDSTAQFQRNADFAESRLELEETALASAGELLQRVRELAVRANNGALNAEDRGAIAAEVREHIDGLLQLANTRDETGGYLFAGFQTGTVPFTRDAAGNVVYNGDQGQRYLQVGPTFQVPVGDPGSDIFMLESSAAGGTSSVFAVLDDFATALDANAPGATIIADLDAALTKVLTARGDVGTRLNAIDGQRSNNESFVLLIEQHRSELEDLDYGEAISRFNQEMLALQAAQQSFVKVQGLSLFNYLR